MAAAAATVGWLAVGLRVQDLAYLQSTNQNSPHYLSNTRKTGELRGNTTTGASCAVGPFSAVSTSRDAALAVPKSREPWLFGTVSVASRLVDTAENEPTAHEAPIIVLFPSSPVFRVFERYLNRGNAGRRAASRRLASPVLVGPNPGRRRRRRHSRNFEGSGGGLRLRCRASGGCVERDQCGAVDR